MSVKQMFAQIGGVHRQIARRWVVGVSDTVTVQADFKNKLDKK